MGHRLPGSRENYFDHHDIDEVAGKYMKANFDSTTEDDAIATLNRRLLLMADYNLREIEGLGNLAALSDEQMQELLRKKWGTSPPSITPKPRVVPRQKVVPMPRVKKLIEKGWEYVTQLPSGEAILRRP